jgi:hypothetical protein
MTDAKQTTFAESEHDIGLWPAAAARGKTFSAGFLISLFVELNYLKKT